MINKDFAIILYWPDATIRGDEAWMMFFKKIGIVKNLNFKVGHTGIVLVDHVTGKMLFYDFGRYITPRGYGRARSVESDPLLKINIHATFENHEISNLEEILNYFETLKEPMYGEDDVYFSVVQDINFSLAKTYADKWVKIGTYPYGAVARNNNNCSRFITRVLMESSDTFNFLHKINFPETLKASPMSNLVNTSPDGMIYSYNQTEGLRKIKMTRWSSFWFLLKQLRDNISSKKASLLPDDSHPGAMTSFRKPENIPHNATYLGGVGDGAWFSVMPVSPNAIVVTRFTSLGKEEYTVTAKTSDYNLDINLPIQITYDSHFMVTHIIQQNIKIRLTHVSALNTETTAEKLKIEEYIN